MITILFLSLPAKVYIFHPQRAMIVPLPIHCQLMIYWVYKPYFYPAYRNIPHEWLLDIGRVRFRLDTTNTAFSFSCCFSFLPEQELNKLNIPITINSIFMVHVFYISSVTSLHHLSNAHTYICKIFRMSSFQILQKV